MSLNWSTFVKTHLNFFNPLQINDRLVNQRNKIFFNRFLVFLKKKRVKIGTLDKLIYLLSNSSVWFTPNIRDFYCRKTTATLIIIKKEN